MSFRQGRDLTRFIFIKTTLAAVWKRGWRRMTVTAWLEVGEKTITVILTDAE